MIVAPRIPPLKSAFAATAEVYFRRHACPFGAESWERSVEDVQKAACGVRMRSTSARSSKIFFPIIDLGPSDLERALASTSIIIASRLSHRKKKNLPRNARLWILEPVVRLVPFDALTRQKRYHGASIFSLIVVRDRHPALGYHDGVTACPSRASQVGTESSQPICGLYAELCRPEALVSLQWRIYCASSMRPLTHGLHC
ncbi:hypothetical protein SISNIDRAFT_469552 [Sistotremastrum niveocremeum HHB9708]|uniref:Uncharacterized protein n=1 Tax=Sistotremastrum niveocremeum HHB9708 TaxID=1314777 RepID=A0A164PU76_9AGAM|nr:hypothetical protein SISNIDRAFT_469552 [Sistotremastrum niveocremeum HHB9708]